MDDAAHAMLPYHEYCAGQGIEDAWVLACSLQIGAADPKAALTRYEGLRIDRANRSEVDGEAFALKLLRAGLVCGPLLDTRQAIESEHTKARGVVYEDD